MTKDTPKPVDAQESRGSSTLTTHKAIPAGHLTPVKAIRAKCRDDCSAGLLKESRYCHIFDCALWPYRMGKKYKSREAMEKDRLVCIQWHEKQQEDLRRGGYE